MIETFLILGSAVLIADLNFRLSDYLKNKKH